MSKEESKFKAGDLPKTTLEVGWTIRDAGIGDDPDESYWPALPPRAPGRGIDSLGLFAVVSALYFCLGAPRDGKFGCSASVARLGEIIGCDESTVSKYISALRELGVIRWVRHTRNDYEINIKKLARAAKHTTARRQKAAGGREKKKTEEQERLAKLWEVDDDEDDTTPAPPAVERTALSAEEQAEEDADLVDLVSEPEPIVPAVVAEEEEEDILAAAARLDAEAEAVQAASSQVAAEDEAETEADDEPEAEAEPAAPVRILDQSDAARELAGKLLRLAGATSITDEDLDDTGTTLFPLVGKYGYDPITQAITWAFAEDWWGPKLRGAGNPGAFFTKSYSSIAKQAAPDLRKKAERRNNPNRGLLNTLAGRAGDDDGDPEEKSDWRTKNAGLLASLRGGN